MGEKAPILTPLRPTGLLAGWPEELPDEDLVDYLGRCTELQAAGLWTKPPGRMEKGRPGLDWPDCLPPMFPTTEK